MKRRKSRILYTVIGILVLLVLWHFILNIPPRYRVTAPKEPDDYAYNDFKNADTACKHKEIIWGARVDWQKRDLRIERVSASQPKGIRQEGSQGLATLEKVVRDNEASVAFVHKGLEHARFLPSSPYDQKRRYSKENDIEFEASNVEYRCKNFINMRAFTLWMGKDQFAAANAIIDQSHFSFICGRTMNANWFYLDGTVASIPASEIRQVVDRYSTALSVRLSYADDIRRQRLEDLYHIEQWVKTYHWYTPRWVIAQPTFHPSTLEPRFVLLNYFYAFTVPNAMVPRIADRYLTASIRAAEQPISSHPRYPDPPPDDINFQYYGRRDRKYEHLRYQLAIFNQDSCLLSIAIQGYRKEHGKYPADLQELIKDKWLKTLPVDPFTLAGPISYINNGKSFTLYSKGPDGDDDGGKPISRKSRSPKSPPTIASSVSMDDVGDVVYRIHRYAGGYHTKYVFADL